MEKALAASGSAEMCNASDNPAGLRNENSKKDSALAMP